MVRAEARMYFPYQLRQAIKILGKAQQGKFTFNEDFTKACLIGKQAIQRALRETLREKTKGG